jgi:hypothetical protein
MLITPLTTAARYNCLLIPVRLVGGTLLSMEKVEKMPIWSLHKFPSKFSEIPPAKRITTFVAAMRPSHTKRE